MGFFTRILGEIWSLIQSVLLNTATAALADDANLGFTAILLIVVTVALMSGCWASSIAETRLHSPKFHFFIGLLLPLVYPLVILFAMPADLPGTALASEEPKPWEDEPAPQKAAAGASPAEGGAPGTPESAEDDEDEFNPGYFRRIARDADGNFVGSWKITTDAQTFIADRILESLPNVVVIETSSLGRQNKPQRLRIPYSKIVSCVRA